MLEARGVSFHYGAGQPWLMRDLDLSIAPDEVVGMPGPSGRGKSTLARILTGYLRPLAGAARVDGLPPDAPGPCPAQLLFQHPELAVNPRWTGRDILAEGWHGGMAASDLLGHLGIAPAWLDRHPHELSGGELQRLCLARSLGPATRYLICDEMTSMLDAMTQARIWEAVLTLARERGLGLLVVSHDAALLQRVCTRIEPFFASTDYIKAVS